MQMHQHRNLTPAIVEKKPDCPLEGKWLQTNVIYQATVATETTTETYVGLATNFKERYRNHKTSFRHSNRNIGTQGVQELFFCELKGFTDSRIKSMTCKMFY